MDSRKTSRCGGPRGRRNMLIPRSRRGGPLPPVFAKRMSPLASLAWPGLSATHGPDAQGGHGWPEQGRPRRSGEYLVLSQVQMGTFWKSAGIERAYQADRPRPLAIAVPQEVRNTNVKFAVGLNGENSRFTSMPSPHSGSWPRTFVKPNRAHTSPAWTAKGRRFAKPAGPDGEADVVAQSRWRSCGGGSVERGGHRGSDVAAARRAMVTRAGDPVGCGVRPADGAGGGDCASEPCLVMAQRVRLRTFRTRVRELCVGMSHPSAYVVLVESRVRRTATPLGCQAVPAQG